MTSAQERLQQRKNDLLDEISDRFNAQQNFLLEKQKQIEEVNQILKRNITQAKDLTKSGNLRKLKPISEGLKEVNTKIQSGASVLDLGENYLAFDSKKGLEVFNKSLDEFGQIYSKGFLPAMLMFGNTEATVGHKATLAVEVCNHQGENV